MKSMKSWKRTMPVSRPLITQEIAHAGHKNEVQFKTMGNIQLHPNMQTAMK
jgi:hypothetical protein